MPATRLAERLGPVTEKKKTHRLQVIRPSGTGDSPHLYGSIQITPHEARAGSNKLVNIPWGFHTRMMKVAVPAGIREGKMLRLKGMGRQLAGGQRGDLFLKVVVKI
jgi:DnaJ-class molecular chaperone